MVELSEDNMPELRVSVPLAQFDKDEWDEFSDFQTSQQDPNCNLEATCLTTAKNDNEFLDNMSDTTENFKDSFSTSLEDLVNTFDDKITKCFHNYEDKVEKYAPVQVRTQEDIMSECQMWWTITGNFGNILPIDWSKSYTRQKFLPVLNLNEAKKLGENLCSVTPSPRTEDDEVANDLDLHQLIISQTETGPPVKSAEEVIKEIDDIMQEGSSSEDESSKDTFPNLSTLPPLLYHDKLKDLSVNDLNDSLLELEMVIRQYSETLISQLALRDELDYEKELKNTFISLLLQVQSKQRFLTIEKKKKQSGPNGVDHKYLTTVIPYDVDHGPLTNQTLQILNKILTAINDDSPTVPTLLTDYILKVLCPS